MSIIDNLIVFGPLLGFVALMIVAFSVASVDSGDSPL